MNDLVLLIDKNPEISEIIRLVLIEDGLECANLDGVFDIGKVITTRPSLIILHNGLNDQGSVTCQSLKNDERTKSIPIIMTSTRPDLERLANENGADAFLNKPFDIYELSKVVRELIDQRLTCI
jgi:DNA-binding response OmpR family regulator